MRITTYRTELDEDLHNILIKEKSYNYPVENLNQPKIIADMLNDCYRLNRQTEEHVYMIALNTKCRPLGVFEISHGTASTSLCNPREIFIKALLCGANMIVLAHNHPSQDVIPSKEDIAVFNKIKETGKMIGINLVDSIIIGNGYYSFSEQK